MPRWLKRFLLAWIAACQVFLFAHSQEPLRLNIGDPWSDANVLSSTRYVRDYGFIATSFTDVLDVGPLTAESYRYIHYPPFAEITYGAISKVLGIESIGVFRLFALTFSALALWLLYLYTRNIYGETVGLVATALWSGSLIWMMYADSIHQAPILQLMTFLGLWALERAIATRQRRFYIAAALGAFGCFFTSYDGWIFFPMAVLFTVYVKAGNPFKRGNRHWVATCAAGCVAAIVAKSLCVIGAVGWTEFVADLRFQFIERSTSDFEGQAISVVAPITRRLTFVFTPLVWVTLGYHAIKAIRAPSIDYALKETCAWMLLCTLAFFYLFSELAASQMLASQAALPIYAIGTAVVIERMLAKGRALRGLGVAWLIVAAAWSWIFLAIIPHTVLPTNDVAAVNAYLEAHDHNDFVLTNLLADGPIQISFHRRYWPLYDGEDDVTRAPNAAHNAQLGVLNMFEQTNTTTITAIYFKKAASRLIDKSIWPLSWRSRQWGLIGAPYMWPAKAARIIDAWDHKVLGGLVAAGAVKIFSGDQLDVYRLDRAAVAAQLEATAPEWTSLDPSGSAAAKAKLLGWSAGAATGYIACSAPLDTPCKTELTKIGGIIPNATAVRPAELMIRSRSSCDLHVRVRLVTPALLRVSMNGYTHQELTSSTDVALTIPADAVRPGVDRLALAPLFRGILGTSAGVISVSSIEVTPCSAAAM